MTGEDKMNRIFVHIGIVTGLLLGGSLSVEAQKKPLDIEACTSWKRIDAPDISPTGRWVTYRISLMEYNPASKEEKKLHLFDSRTGSFLSVGRLGRSNENIFVVIAFGSKDRMET